MTGRLSPPAVGFIITQTVTLVLPKWGKKKTKTAIQWIFMVVLKHLKNIIKDAASSAFHVLLGLGARTSTDKAGPGQPREAAPGGASPGDHALCNLA